MQYYLCLGGSLWPPVGGQGRGRSSTASSCGHHGWFAPNRRCWGDPVGPGGCALVVVPLVGATGVVGIRPKWQVMATRGQGGAEALLALVAAVGGLP